LRQRGGIPYAKEELVEFLDGPWDGVVLNLKMPPPARTFVGNLPPQRSPVGKPLRLDELLPGGPHRYDRVETTAGFRYRYRGTGM
jgi:hypothetical protein